MGLNGYKKPLIGALSLALAIIGWAVASWVRMVEQHVHESSAEYQRVRVNQERIRQLEDRVIVLERGRGFR